MTVRFHIEAPAEADAAQYGYETRQVGLGHRFLDALVDTIETVRDHPGRWPRDRTVATHREVRFVTLAPFAYRVIYEVFEDEIVILAVAHLRRRSGFWRRRKA